MAYINHEAIEQIKVAEFLRQCTDLLFIHPPNERKASPQQGALLKRMGVVSGCPDLIIFRRFSVYCGLMIEMKYGKGRLSVNQAKFLGRAREEGWKCEVCYKAEEAIYLIRHYYGLPEKSSFLFDSSSFLDLKRKQPAEGV